MPKATTKVSGMAIQPDQPNFRRNQHMANAMAVAITISALSSSFRDENKSTGLTRGFIDIKPGLLLFFGCHHAVGGSKA